jgi:hypothetical protein
VKSAVTPGSLGTDTTRRQATRYFTVGGGSGSLFRMVKTEDIKIVRNNAIFRPYWMDLLNWKVVIGLGTG